MKCPIELKNNSIVSSQSQWLEHKLQEMSPKVSTCYNSSTQLQPYPTFSYPSHTPPPPPPVLCVL